MKKNTFLFVFSLLLLIGCSRKSQPDYKAEVLFESKESDATIIVRSTGYGKDEKAATADAQKNAVSVILFKGLPGSGWREPIVNNENESKEDNPRYYKNLFEKGFINTFIIASDVVYPYNSNKKIVVVIRLNIVALRTDLEVNKIIRKFGY